MKQKYANIPTIPQQNVHHQPPATINSKMPISLYCCPQPSLKKIPCLKHSPTIQANYKTSQPNIVPAINLTNATNPNISAMNLLLSWFTNHQPSTINHQPSTRPQELQLPRHGRSFLLSFAGRPLAAPHGAQPLHPPQAAVVEHRGERLAAQPQELLTGDGPKEGHGNMAKLTWRLGCWNMGRFGCYIWMFDWNTAVYCCYPYVSSSIQLLAGCSILARTRISGYY